MRWQQDMRQGSIPYWFIFHEQVPGFKQAWDQITELPNYW